MEDTELKTCDESSEEYMMFFQVMEALQALCGKEFAMFQVIGYRILPKDESISGNVYETKIRVAESGDDNTVHAKIWKPEGEEEV